MSSNQILPVGQIKRIFIKCRDSLLKTFYFSDETIIKMLWFELGTWGNKKATVLKTLEILWKEESYGGV